MPGGQLARVGESSMRGTHIVRLDSQDRSVLQTVHFMSLPGHVDVEI